MVHGNIRELENNEIVYLNIRVKQGLSYSYNLFSLLLLVYLSLTGKLYIAVFQWVSLTFPQDPETG